MLTPINIRAGQINNAIRLLAILAQLAVVKYKFDNVKKLDINKRIAPKIHIQPTFFLIFS